MALTHLVLVPRGGLGNRLRTIASARRLCERVGARCTVVWREGNFDELFAPVPDLEAVRTLPSELAGCRTITMLNGYEGGAAANRVVPIAAESTIVVRSCHVFGAEGEPPVRRSDVVPRWLLRPSAAIRSAVEEFAAARFVRTVGMHIRQGDNGRTVLVPPLDPFLREAEQLIAEGRTVFLATDSAETHETMRTSFGDRVVVQPKTWNLPFRWPLPTWDGGALAVDFLDMQLLATCDYVIGWAHSTFGVMAALYNGSPECHLMPEPRPDPRLGRVLADTVRPARRALARGSTTFSSRSMT